MAVLTNVDNAAFDVLLAAVTFAPYTPITRVSDLNTAPFVRPNSNVQYVVQSALGEQFTISADELGVPVVREEIIFRAHGLRALLIAVSAFATALTTLFTDNPATTIQSRSWTDLIRAFQAFKPIWGMLPKKAFEEFGDPVPLLADFSTVVLVKTVTITDECEGHITTKLWSFGDGKTFVGDNPPPHVYASAGNWDINLTILSPQAPYIKTVSATVTTT